MGTETQRSHPQTVSLASSQSRHSSQLHTTESKKRTHPPRHVVNHVGGGDMIGRSPTVGSSAEFIHTADWRRGQKLIRLELGPPPPGMTKAEKPPPDSEIRTRKPLGERVKVTRSL